MDDMDEDFVVPPQELDDESEEEGEEEEEEEEESDEEEEDGVLDAGVAGPTEEGKPRKNASQADITLYLTCTQPPAFAKNHSILKIGVTVQIGLSKSCKLSSVFDRYVEFCNENDMSGGRSVELTDLEFVHSQILNGADTAEAAALMKNDRISVRREQSAQRRNEEAFLRLQRDTDKVYFAQLRHFLPTQTASGRTSPDFLYNYADAVLDCRGTLPDVGGLRLFDDEEHNLMSEGTTVRCHSVVVAKRCPWLGRILSAARQEHARRSVVTLPESSEDTKGSTSQDEDFDRLQLKMRPGEGKNDPEAAEIENDDEEQQGDAEIRRYNGMDDDTSVNDSTRNSKNLLYVRIEKHSPDAIKLLLEYCYSNRVVPLGYHAFIESCKTKPHYKKQTGPVAPISNRPVRWPKFGEPSISFAVALAGIQLAEEALMPRLSLMCEVAASRLVEDTCAVDALVACETQRNLTGNALPRLRKAAMDIVLRSKNHGPSALLSDTLEEKGHLLVPALLTGTMEAVEAAEKKKKKAKILGCFGQERDWKAVAYSSFKKYDRIDAMERQRERQKRRGGNDSEDSSMAYDDDEEDDFFHHNCWVEQTKKQSLKRLSHHMGGRMASQIASKMARRNSGGKTNKRSLH